MLWKPLLVGFCIVVWELHSVFSNLCIDRTRPQHREPTEILETSRNFNKSTGLTITGNEEDLYWPAVHVEDSENNYKTVEGTLSHRTYARNGEALGRLRENC